MKVTFLGTGTSQGIPVIGSDHPVCLSTDFKDKRLRASILVQINDFNIVVDCTPDFRTQMLSNPIPTLDALLFTHEHSDHTAGIDDIRPYYFKQGDIPIYAHNRVIGSLKRRFDYIFEVENKYPGAPGVLINEVVNNHKIALDGGIDVVPINCFHGDLQVFGYRILDVAYLTDVKTVPEEELGKLKNLDVLIINALRISPHKTHFNLEEALNFITLVQPKKAYLTHISHLLGFHEVIAKQLPHNVFLAYDNLTIEI